MEGPRRAPRRQRDRDHRRRIPVGAVNLLLRLHIAYFLWEVVTHPDDHRFRGKAIPIRNLIIVGGLSFLFPLVHVITKRWRHYPWALDDLYLSIFWLDMAGNSFDLYDRYRDFDLIPHLHGTGALAVVLEGAFGWRRRRAILGANGIHSLLEAQEILTDVFVGTRNVRGPWDTARDLAVGILGTLAYPRIEGLRDAAVGVAAGAGPLIHRPSTAQA